MAGVVGSVADVLWVVERLCGARYPAVGTTVQTNLIDFFRFQISIACNMQLWASSTGGRVRMAYFQNLAQFLIKNPTYWEST